MRQPSKPAFIAPDMAMVRRLFYDARAKDGVSLEKAFNLHAMATKREITAIIKEVSRRHPGIADAWISPDAHSFLLRGRVWTAKLADLASRLAQGIQHSFFPAYNVFIDGQFTRIGATPSEWERVYCKITDLGNRKSASRFVRFVADVVVLLSRSVDDGN